MFGKNIYSCCECSEGVLLQKQEETLVCPSCGTSFTLKGGKIFFTAPPANIAVNEESGADDKSRWTPLRRAQHEFVSLSLADAGKAAAICDLGAGPGQSREIFERFPNYIGVDIYPYPNVSVIADIEKRLPFRSVSFDIALALSAFEHVHRVQPLLAEIFRILKPRGTLVGATPFLLGIHQAPYDFHRFTRYELEKLLAEAGFADIRVTPLATAYDWYRTSEAHFFMKLFDSARSLSRSKFIPVFFAVKIVWNLQKYFTRLASPLLRLNNDDTNTLGYGFIARKPSQS